VTLNLAETSLVKSRPSFPHGAIFSVLASDGSHKDCGIPSLS